MKGNQANYSYESRIIVAGTIFMRGIWNPLPHISFHFISRIVYIVNSNEKCGCSEIVTMVYRVVWKNQKVHSCITKLFQNKRYNRKLIIYSTRRYAHTFLFKINLNAEINHVTRTHLWTAPNIIASINKSSLDIVYWWMFLSSYRYIRAYMLGYIWCTGNNVAHWRWSQDNDSGLYHCKVTVSIT